MEDDLVALIKAEAREDQKVIVAGHSSGGGLVVRFAGGEHGALMDEAILFAPFLKYNAPTTRENSGGWAHAMTRRIIGLSMLNTFTITALNYLEIIQFNMPKSRARGKIRPSCHAFLHLSFEHRLRAADGLPEGYRRFAQFHADRWCAG